MERGGVGLELRLRQILLAVRQHLSQPCYLSLIRSGCTSAIKTCSQVLFSCRTRSEASLPVYRCFTKCKLGAGACCLAGSATLLQRIACCLASPQRAGDQTRVNFRRLNGVLTVGGVLPPKVLLDCMLRSPILPSARCRLCLGLSRTPLHSQVPCLLRQSLPKANKF